MFANFGRYAFFSYVMHTVWSQEQVQLSFSSNPVCNTENVTLTWTYTSPFQYVRMTVDAFNGTRKEGSLFYRGRPANSTGVGVFAGKNLNGWPNISLDSTSFSLTLTATPSLELDYNCSLKLFDDITSASPVYTSAPARLLVYVSPLPPRILPSPIIFNKSDSGVIVCESPHGKPAAAVFLTVTRASGGALAPGYGINSARVDLTLPLLQWHNAVATCSVANYNCSNLDSPNELVKVIHVAVGSVPDVIYNNESTVLNCSAYISYYPGVQYSWSIPPAVNISGSLYIEWLIVPPGQNGSFYCTATNNVTMESVVIPFTVSNSSRPAKNQDSSGCELCWIIGLVLGIIAVVIIAVVLGVLCKRGHYSKGKKKPGVQSGGAEQRSDNGSNRVHLLIAAEGVVSDLPLRTLQSTAIVQYSDRSCSLNGILEKVEQAVTQSATKFKSVALLLRPAAVGVTLSEVDQAVLNSSTIKGEKGEKLRTFIARLAKICLDARDGTRMDILNYKTGKAPKRLSEAVTGLLKIPTTVSQDQFGVETPIGNKGGHAVVADLYFDRNNLGEVVYAVLELPTVKPPIQPRPVDEGVTYSEIRR